MDRPKSSVRSRSPRPGASANHNKIDPPNPRRKVDTGYLYDYSDADVVPSGVAELAHLQAQGYT